MYVKKWLFLLLLAIACSAQNVKHTAENTAALPREEYNRLATVYAAACDSLAASRWPAAAGLFREVVEKDSAMHFLAVYRLLENCYTETAAFDSAMAAYKTGIERAEQWTGTAHQQAAAVLEEWLADYETYLRNNQQRTQNLESGPRAINGATEIAKNLAYPDSAIAGVFHGQVKVLARVTENGIVDAAFIRETSTLLDYDMAAISAIKQTPFEPAKNATGPITVWIVMPVVFK